MKIKKMLTMLAVVMLFVCMFGITVSAEDGAMFYAPYYDEETGSIVGAPEVGDWIPEGATFSGEHLPEYKYIIITTYGTAEEAAEKGYGYTSWISSGEEDAPVVCGTFGDPTGGWIVTDVYYEIEEDWDDPYAYIRIDGYMVNGFNIIDDIEISIDWSKIGYFRIGKELTYASSGFYNVSSEYISESCDNGFAIKATEEHVEKGYISQYTYDDALEYSDGWVDAYRYQNGYVVSATDEICYTFDAHSSDPWSEVKSYVFAYSMWDVDISRNVTVLTDNVTLLDAVNSPYMMPGDVAFFRVYLGTAEEIIEKAGINNDVEYYGWKKIGDLWYYFDASGNLVKNQWRKDSKGWCYLGEGGYMLTKEFVEDSKGTCYVGADGYIVYNKWVQDEWGDWYYIGADGYKVTNKWVKDSKGWCYLGSYGYMYYDEFVEDSKGMCYVGEDGYMVYNQWVENWDGRAYVGSNGYCETNKWKKYEGNWVYLGKDGFVVTDQWVKDSVGWCYVDYDGFMVYNEWIEDSVGLCYVGSNGYMVYNKWVYDGWDWSYVGANGYMVTEKWVKDSVGWCYLDDYGYMVRDTWVEDSKGMCYVGEDGYMVTNAWVEYYGDMYYMNGSGYMTIGWKVIDGNWYYFYEDGCLARDTYIGNDYVDENGVWVA